MYVHLNSLQHYVFIILNENLMKLEIEAKA